MKRPHRPFVPHVEVEAVGPVTVAHLREPRLVDELIVDALGKELTALLERLGPGTLLLDFAAVENLSSMVVATLLQLRKRASETGARVALCALQPDVVEILALTGVDRVLTVFATEQKALQGL